MSTSTAQIERCGARVVWHIGARNDAYEFAVDDDRFNKYEIANAIIETESEIVQLMAGVHHPGLGLLRKWVDVDNGEEVPKHLGKIIAVRATSACSEDEVMEPASRTDVKLWRDNHNSIFSDATCGGNAGYYNLTNEVIIFTGDTAEALVVQYNPKFPSVATEYIGELQIDAIYEPMLINGTIARLGKLGVPAAIVQQNQSQYDAARQMMAQGAMGLPEVDVKQIGDSRG